MYDFFRGKLAEATTDYAVVDVNGVGYKFFIPLSSLGKLPTQGKEVFLFASFVVRELSHSLYGFTERDERDLFEVLIEISGIGPKTALNLIGHLSFSQFQEAIQTENILALSKVPGIGKKTAERLIVEMRGKKTFSLIKSGSSPSVTTPLVKDALNTLLNLGLTHAIAEQAIKKALEEVPAESDLSALVAAALRAKRILSNSK